MLYIYAQNTGLASDPKHTNSSRPAHRRSGQETSANGTGPEKTWQQE